MEQVWLPSERQKSWAGHFLDCMNAARWYCMKKSFTNPAEFFISYF